MAITTPTLLRSRVSVSLGVIAIVVWLHYLQNLWPLPPRYGLPAQLEWSLWRENLVLISLGLLAAALAVRGIRFWHVALLATSGYMVASSIPYMVADLIRAGSFDAWFGPFRNARPTTLYYLFVVPLYHLGIVVAVMVYWVFLLRARSHAGRHAA